MNELIEKLAERATKEMDQEAFSEDMNIPAEWYHKFAELIVRECVDVIRKEVSLKYKDGGETEEFMGGHYASSLLARVKIKRHFGVEE